VDNDIIRALRSFDLDQSHDKVYADPNELVQNGFPSSFLLPLITNFESSDEYVYFWEGNVVRELIGISHASLVYAIAKHVGVPSEMGSRFTGRGFAMRAVIDAIRDILAK
jgi:hypothetical protein